MGIIQYFLFFKPFFFILIKFIRVMKKIWYYSEWNWKLSGYLHLWFIITYFLFHNLFNIFLNFFNIILLLFLICKLRFLFCKVLFFTIVSKNMKTLNQTLFEITSNFRDIFRYILKLLIFTFIYFNY